MERNDILAVGRKITCYLGTFEISELDHLNIVKNDIGFIVIEQEHAVAVYITEKSIEVFDPLGLGNSAVFSPICAFLAEHLPCKSLQISAKFQSDLSNSCAKFCLIFLYLRCHGYPFHTVHNLFSCDLVSNEHKVDALFDSLFK